MKKEMKKRKIIEEEKMKKIRKYADGRILIGRRSQRGLFGYDGSNDYNRFLLFLDGRAWQHCYSGRRRAFGDKIKWEGKIYEIRGQY